MNDWDVGSRNLVHSNVTSLISLVRGVGQEKKISTVESRFHRSTAGGKKNEFGGSANRNHVNSAPQHNDNWRFGVGDDPKAFPDHQPRSNYRRKIENLEQNLQTKSQKADRMKVISDMNYMPKSQAFEGFEFLSEHDDLCPQMSALLGV